MRIVSVLFQQSNGTLNIGFPHISSSIASNEIDLGTKSANVMGDGNACVPKCNHGAEQF